MSDVLLAGELDRDEKLIWAGKPAPARYAWFYSWRNMLNGLICIIGALFSSNSILNVWKPWLDLSIFAIIFIIIWVFLCIYSIVTPILFYLRGKKVVYALTSKRAIRAIFRKKVTIDSTYFVNFAEISKKANVDGSGNLYFTTWTIVTNSPELPPEKAPDGFIGISGANEVERLLRDEFQKNVTAKARTN